MVERTLRLATRFARRGFALGILSAPAVFAVGFLIDLDVGALTARNARSLLDGEIGDETVLLGCGVVMAATWSRVMWIVIVVSASRLRRREVRGTDRFLVRLVLRTLVLTPVVLDATAPQVRASPTSGIVGLGEESKGFTADLSNRNVLLVSIVVAAGVSMHLRHRRRDALRIDSPPPDDTTTRRFESDVVRRGHDVALHRFELAVRSLVAGGHRNFSWLVQHESGLVHVECRRAGIDPPPWTRVSEEILVLDTSSSADELEAITSACDVRVPVILPVGNTDAGVVWFNLEYSGSFYVDGRHEEADAVWDGLCQSLSMSPLNRSVHLVGSSDNGLFGRRQLVVRDETAVLSLTRVLHDEESPCVVLVSEGPRRILRIEGPGRCGETPHGLVMRNGRWLLLPLQQRVEPTMCTSFDRHTLRALVGAETPPVTCIPRAHDGNSGHVADLDQHPLMRRWLSDVSFVVRVMGRPGVDHVRHGRVQFERSKSEELVIWLALHPQRRLRSSARADMWNAPVKDSTFSNITSDVRRSLIALELPPRDDQWLGVTHKDDLPLHQRIVSDVVLLEKCIDHVRRYPEEDGLGLLSRGLDFVQGCPLEGSRYLWRDATGITTDIATLIVRAATMCSEMALECDDQETLMRCSSKGLAAVPGHEGLVSLRLRHHAEVGDRGSLAVEWESYCRSLLDDAWGDSQPSPQMIDLWRTLSGRSPRRT